LQGFFDLFYSVPFIIKLIGLRRIKKCQVESVET
jgi:hypothetical protein